MSRLYTITEKTLSNIANAIRSKTGKNDPIKTDDFPSEIESISGSEDLEAVLSEQESLIAELKTELSNKATGSGGGSADSETLAELLEKGTAGISELKSEAPTVIGKNFFSNGNLHTIDLPNVTSVGERAFEWCCYLESINMPNLIECGYRSFAETARNVLANWEFPKLTKVAGSAFYNSGIDTIDLPLATTIGGGAFSDCNNLKSFNIPLVTLIESGAFQGCSKLTNVVLEQEARMHIGTEAFMDCTSLKSIDLHAPTAIQSFAFFGCSSLDTIILRSAEEAYFDISAVVNTKMLGIDGTPSGEGFIYVQSSLYEGFVAHLVPQVIALAESSGMAMDEGTATYIATSILRKIEDYPEVCG